MTDRMEANSWAKLSFRRARGTQERRLVVINSTHFVIESTHHFVGVELGLHGDLAATELISTPLRRYESTRPWLLMASISVSAHAQQANVIKLLRVAHKLMNVVHDSLANR